MVDTVGLVLAAIWIRESEGSSTDLEEERRRRERGKERRRGWMQNDHLGFRGWCGWVEDSRWIPDHPTVFDARSA